MGNSSKISDDFRISIPEEVREREGWKPGEELAFVPQGGRYVLVRVPTMEELFGIAKGADTSNYRDRNDRY